MLSSISKILISQKGLITNDPYSFYPADINIHHLNANILSMASLELYVMGIGHFFSLNFRKKFKKELDFLTRFPSEIIWFNLVILLKH